MERPFQDAQPRVRFLELGPADRLAEKLGRDSLDIETIQAIGEKYGVSSVFTGSFEIKVSGLATRKETPGNDRAGSRRRPAPLDQDYAQAGGIRAPSRFPANPIDKVEGNAVIEKRALGNSGPSIGCIGYGAMVLEGYYGESDDEQAVETIRRALDAGMTMIDTADAYGNGHNERLLSRAIKGQRDRAFLATKFGIAFDEKESGTEVPTGWGFSLKINGKPEFARKALDASLKRLGVETIDLWYAHYPDPGTPIEVTVEAMAEGVRAGKVRYLGLSNVTPEHVRRAQSVHPIQAVQYEFSLWRREAETVLLPTLRELGIALVAWSPLGSGFLAGTVGSLGNNDFRRNNPRYTAENLAKNTDRFAPLMQLARGLGVTPAQLALAWLLHQGRDVFPIPGTRRPERVEENARAADISLDQETLRRIDELAPPGIAAGETLL